MAEPGSVDAYGFDAADITCLCGEVVPFFVLWGANPCRRCGRVWTANVVARLLEPNEYGYAPVNAVPVEA